MHFVEPVQVSELLALDLLKLFELCRRIFVYTHMYAHPLLVNLSVFPDCTSETVRAVRGGGEHVYIYIYISLPELVDFKLFGKTIVVVNKKFDLFWPVNLGSAIYIYTHMCATLKARAFFGVYWGGRFQYSAQNTV